ncbi:hypothetical protein ACA910_018383 [Epithemia clementina (nom. ined.)]
MAPTLPSPLSASAAAAQEANKETNVNVSTAAATTSTNNFITNSVTVARKDGDIDSDVDDNQDDDEEENLSANGGRLDTVFIRDSMIGAILTQGQEQQDEKQQPKSPSDQSKKKQNNKKNEFWSAMTSTRSTTKSLHRDHSQQYGPVCRQYIVDRVKGQSYVPRVYRSLPTSGGLAHHYHRDEDNPTDWYNRPPHFFCYLPPFVAACPTLLEQNPVCECVGKCGFHRYFKNHHKMRRRIFFVGFTFNLAALCLTIVSAMAGSSQHFDLLSHTSFTRGQGRIFLVSQNNNNTNNNNTLTTSPSSSTATNATSSSFMQQEEIGSLTIDIGFWALAWYDPEALTTDSATVWQQNSTNGDKSKNEFIKTIANFCEKAEDAARQSRINKNNNQQTSGFLQLQMLLGGELCGSCQGSSQSFILSSVINICIILRNMFSDITRMYPKYDLNCPNFYGSLMATASVLLGIYTIFAYRQRCQHDLQTEFFLVWYNDSNNNNSNNMTSTTRLVDADVDGDGFLNTNYDIQVILEWDNGPGFTCLMIATFLKVMDAIVNYMVPTPTITRSWEERQDYELEFGTTTTSILSGTTTIAATPEDHELDLAAEVAAAARRQQRQKEQEQQQEQQQGPKGSNRHNNTSRSNNSKSKKNNNLTTVAAINGNDNDKKGRALQCDKNVEDSDGTSARAFLKRHEKCLSGSDDDGTDDVVVDTDKLNRSNNRNTKDAAAAAAEFTTTTNNNKKKKSATHQMVQKHEAQVLSQPRVATTAVVSRNQSALQSAMENATW